MQLPQTSNPLLFWMDPSEKFVYKDSSNKITSILNRVNGERILPPTIGPTWVDNSLNGHPTLSFTGSQSLIYNFNQNGASSGFKKPFIMMSVARTLSPVSPQSVLMQGFDRSVSALSSVQYTIFSSNAVSISKIDDIGNAGFTSGAAIDTKYHLYCNIYDGTLLKQRIDGKEVNSGDANAIVNSNMNQISIGDLSPLAASLAVHFYFTGNIATTLAYTTNYGCSIDYSAEDYLMKYYGL